MHDGNGYTLHLSDSEISDDPVGGIGSTDGYMVAFLQAERGEHIRHTAEFGIHPAVGIVIATGGILGGAIFGEIEIRESRLVPVGADRFREDVKVISCHDFSK